MIFVGVTRPPAPKRGVCLEPKKEKARCLTAR